GESGGRLHDLGLILTAYDKLVAERATDPRDRLTRLAEKLTESGYAKGKDFYIDCFTDFTPQEKAVLSALMRDGHSVTIALTCDTLDREGASIFAPARRTALELISLAREQHVGVSYDTLQGRADQAPAELAYLEQHLFDTEVPPYGRSCQAVQLYNLERTYDEVEQAAGAILALVREQGYRYRDIAVTARTLEGYDELIETVFARYNIPVFLGKQVNILEKPILTLLTSALDAIDGYEYDDVFRYLKTGLTGATPEQVDALENYVLQWDIRGSKWYQARDWDWNPAGYAQPWTEENRALVAQLDALRREIVAPLETLRKTKDASGASLSRSLYRFLEEIALPQRLEERAALLTQRGELRQAEEYRQLWDILVGALEQCAALMSEQPIRLKQFAELFQLVLSQYSVATIPVALDRVSVGDILRTAHKEAKVVFLLGADDAHFPLVGQTAGLLTQEDRELLA
ncbi:MAG: ATP-dependent nuclease subunit B, partial [Clostridiales bacterium]|nr:ATP-dependent nuclease subunit B [Clostridiales bacterium]